MSRLCISSTTTYTVSFCIHVFVQNWIPGNSRLCDVWTSHCVTLIGHSARSISSIWVPQSVSPSMFLKIVSLAARFCSHFLDQLSPVVGMTKKNANVALIFVFLHKMVQVCSLVVVGQWMLFAGWQGREGLWMNWAAHKPDCNSEAHQGGFSVPVIIVERVLSKNLGRGVQPTLWNPGPFKTQRCEFCYPHLSK